MPTSLQQAKTFLRKRLNAEQSESRNLETELLIFASLLLRLYKKYNCTPDSIQAKTNPMLQAEIAILLRNFKDALYSDLELLCTEANPDHKDAILVLMNEAIHGTTLRSRIDHWSALVLAYLSNQITKGVTTFRHIPLTIDGMYGLDRLFRQTISNIYMTEWRNLHPDSQGFYSYRGSSYPCPYCDDMVGYHPIKDYPSYGSWHVNCRCIIVFT